MVNIPVVHQVLEANEALAQELRAGFARHGVYVVNLLGSPGAGKTSLLEQTLARAGGLRIGVVEGDLATSLDAERIARSGAPVVQVNTGGGCHLDAATVQSALQSLPLTELDVLVIENVGNLVCPAAFDLGEADKVVISSVTEGDDKVAKYPSVFSAAAAVVLNKTDLAPYVNFSFDNFRHYIGAINSAAPVFEISCTSGEGLDAWIGWLKGRRASTGSSA